MIDLLHGDRALFPLLWFMLAGFVASAKGKIDYNDAC